MLRKRSTMTIVNRRSVTAFFNRVAEIYERKFDGFPATVNAPTTAPLLLDPNTTGIDAGSIIDRITGDILQADIPQCGDISAEECRQEVATVLAASAFANQNKYFARCNYQGFTNVVGSTNSSYVGYGPNTTFNELQQCPPGPTISHSESLHERRNFLRFATTNSSATHYRFSATANWSVGATAAFDIYVIAVNPTNGLVCDPTPVPGFNDGDLVATFTFDSKTTGSTGQTMSVDIPKPSGSELYIRTQNAYTTPGLNANLGNIKLTPISIEFDFAGCSDKSFTETLTLTDGEFVPSVPASYYVSVWIDGLAAVVGEDYTVFNGNIIPTQFDSNTEVVARYVA